MPNQTDTLRRGRRASGAMFLVNGFLMGSWAPQIPLLLPRHQIDETTLGLLILMLGVGAVGAMALTGGLIGRYGSRPVLRAFAMTAPLAFAAVVASPNLWLLTVALVVMGAMIGCMDVAMNANAVELERRFGRALMSASHGFWSLGGFIGGGAGGWIITGIGVQGHALAASVAAMAVVMFAGPHLVEEAPHPPSSSNGPARKGWPRTVPIYILGLMSFLCMVPEGAVLDWAALYLQLDHGSGTAQSGLAFALFSASMAIMRFAGDFVRNLYGAVMTLRVSALVAAAGMFGATLAPTEALVIASFAFAGLGVANLVPVLFSAGGNYPGLGRGVGISIITMMGYSGILVAPSSIGYVADLIGFRVTFGIMALLLIGVALLANRVAIADFKTRPGPAGRNLPA